MESKRNVACPFIYRCVSIGVISSIDDILSVLRVIKEEML